MSSIGLSILASVALAWTITSLMTADTERRAIKAVGWAFVTWILLFAAYATELLS